MRRSHPSTGLTASVPARPLSVPPRGGLHPQGTPHGSLRAEFSIEPSRQRAAASRAAHSSLDADIAIWRSCWAPAPTTRACTPSTPRHSRRACRRRRAAASFPERQSAITSPLVHAHVLSIELRCSCVYTERRSSGSVTRHTSVASRSRATMLFQSPATLEKKAAGQCSALVKSTVHGGVDPHIRTGRL